MILPACEFREKRGSALVHQNYQCLQCPWAGVVVTGSYAVDERYQHPLLVFGGGVELVEEVGGRR